MRRKVALIALILFGASVSMVFADNPRFDPEAMMRSSELQRGMKGYGLSVFEGVEIERFDLEILGVLSKARLGEDMILVRVTSGPVVERESGIIGGMSGSPVYVDGKLIGAIAYGWGFLREAIGGVTPIESMLRIYDEGERQASLPAEHGLRGAKIAGRWIEEARIARAESPFHDDRTVNLRPLSPVINVAGMGERSMKRLTDLFEPHGLETTPGPGPLADPVPAELEPGAAVGVRLMEGDFDISGIGTVTWRNQDHVLAFGHPMMEMGPVNIPLTSAWVHDFLPSIQISSKLASPMETVGAVVRDGSWSVAGQMEEEAAMVPASFYVTDEDRGVSRDFSVRVARHEQLTSALMMSAFMSSIEATYNIGGRGVASLDFELTGEDGAVIRRRDTIYHPGMLRPVVSWVDEALYFMTQNRFEPQQPASLKASVSLSDEEQLAAVERVYTDETVARAGEQLTVRVVLRPEKGERFEEVVTFDLPEDLPQGTIRVGAAAGGSEYSLRQNLRLLMPQLDSLEDIARIIETMKRSDQLYVAAAIPRVSLGLEGEELPLVPRSMQRILADDEQSLVTAGHTEVSETLDSDYCLFGMEVLRMPTEDRKGERGRVRPLPEAERPQETARTTDGIKLEHTWWAASALDLGGRPAQESDLPEAVLPAEPDEAPELEEVKEEVLREREERENDTIEHPEPDGEALARGLSHTAHTTAEHFEKGETDGTMVRSDGAVLLAPRPELIAQVSEPGIWSIAASGDTMWFGTSNPGRIYRWREGTEPKIICETGSMMVLSILPRDDGSILAGTGPDGRVLVIGADGSIEREHRLAANYVWSLEEHDGAVLAGTGPRGEIFRLEDRPVLLARVRQRHVQDLLSADGRLYAAAGDDQGIVVEILPGGSVRGVFGSDESSVTGIAIDGQGRLVVATAEDGKLHRVLPDDRHDEVYESDGNVLAVASAGGRIWAATTDEGRIVVLDEEDRTAIAHRDTKTDQTMAIAGTDDAVFAATANPGRVWRLRINELTEGTYVSEAIDAERVARWSRMEWDATVPDDAELTIDARSGNSKTETDGSWSSWTDLLRRPGEALLAPAARYLQYRLRLSGSPGGGPEVRRAEVLYQPQNRRPTLEVSEPKPGRSIRNEFDVTWTARDEDGDTLEIALSYREASTDRWNEITTLEDKNSYEWDTREIDDGVYDLRVVVTDEPSNPIGAREREVVVENVTIDNTPPTLRILSTPRRGDEAPTLWGLATDRLSRIISVDWTFGSEERWRAAVPDDGLFDSRSELFTVRLPDVPEEEVSLQIRARDAAGNVTIETIPLLDQHPAFLEESDLEEEAPVTEEEPALEQKPPAEG